MRSNLKKALSKMSMFFSGSLRTHMVPSLAAWWRSVFTSCRRFYTAARPHELGCMRLSEGRRCEAFTSEGHFLRRLPDCPRGQRENDGPDYSRGWVTASRGEPTRPPPPALPFTGANLATLLSRGSHGADIKALFFLRTKRRAAISSFHLRVACEGSELRPSGLQERNEPWLEAGKEENSLRKQFLFCFPFRLFNKEQRNTTK